MRQCATSDALQRMGFGFRAGSKLSVTVRTASGQGSNQKPSKGNGGHLGMKPRVQVISDRVAGRRYVDERTLPCSCF